MLHAWGEGLQGKQKLQDVEPVDAHPQRNISEKTAAEFADKGAHQIWRG